MLFSDVGITCNLDNYLIFNEQQRADISTHSLTKVIRKSVLCFDIVEEDAL